MKQESTLDKKLAGKSITDSAFLIWLKNQLHSFMVFLAGTVITCKVEVLNAYVPIPDKPIIFAVNHGAFLDTPISIRVIKERSYILAGKQNLGFIEWLFFMLNGVIWVDRASKEDMAASKDGLLSYLGKGQSIIWFPEGTWNLSSNQLMLPMRWGIVDIAKHAGAQIIPVALDYNWEKNICKVKFGTPMTDATLENKIDAIRDLRDAMATLRWDLMCQDSVLHRANTTPKQLRKEMCSVLEKYQPANWEQECTYIYQPYEDVDIVPSGLIPNRNNVFLFRKA